VPWVVNEAIRRSGTHSFPRNPLKEFRIYVSAQTDDDFPYILRYGGEDNLVIGTDYGHTDASSEVDAIIVFRGNHSISDDTKRKILDANPRELYGLQDR
jgi:predicted TIM-barrel fold metal-dependent hydrolase